MRSAAVRIPAALVADCARPPLAVPVESLMGEDAKPARRGPSPKLLQQIERIRRLPKAQQRFVMQMIDTALQASRDRSRRVTARYGDGATVPRCNGCTG